MPKKIILLSDGTGNSAGKFWKTNVWRLYKALDLSDKDQLAYYQDGIGNSLFKPLAILGGAFGWGLKRNVLDLYTFLCRNYTKDDQIYCFGFSRGAFTIRVLLGFIRDQGLVEASTEKERRRLAKNAYRHYRRTYRKTNLLVQGGRKLRDLSLHSYEKICGQNEYQPKEVETEKPAITFVGLWDTVAAYGLPFDELTRFWNTHIFPLSTPDRNLGNDVKRACHALALDDERQTFHPVLWNEEEEQKECLHQEKISQVWFAGAHSDVGGGYPDDALSYVSLNWMVAEAARHGVNFRLTERTRIYLMADSCAPKHDSRRGFGIFYRYLPRKLEELIHDTQDEENYVIITRPKIHESVFDRMCRDGDRYVPIVLPKEYAVVTSQGDILNVGGNHAPVCTNTTKDEKCPRMGRTLNIPSATLHEKFCEDSKRAEQRVHLQEQVRDLVWKKRRLYFLSLVPATALALFPLWQPARVPCDGIDCALSPVLSWMRFFLPDFMSPWIQSFQNHPALFLLLVCLLVVLSLRQKSLQTAIHDTMYATWNQAGLERPPDSIPTPTPASIPFPLPGKGS